jgi:hypothetical protein
MSTAAGMRCHSPSLSDGAASRVFGLEIRLRDLAIGAAIDECEP